MAEHDHDHDHQHGSELSETQLRVRALETVLTEKGYIDPAALDAIIEAYETKVGPHNGARVVAKAWSDPAFKRDLLRRYADPTRLALIETVKAMDGMWVTTLADIAAHAQRSCTETRVHTRFDIPTFPNVEIRRTPPLG